ncbi:MAG: type IV pilin protein, partial [Candidatus Methylomirabilales bacterium]
MGHGQRSRVHGAGFRPQRNDRPPGPRGTSLNHELLTTNQQGFTFIEMMIVLVIIGILLSIAQPSFSTSVR